MEEPPQKLDGISAVEVLWLVGLKMSRLVPVCTHCISTCSAFVHVFSVVWHEDVELADEACLGG